MPRLNPYISGPPVTGPDFYGRQDQLDNVLKTKHKLILYVATRRIGKTSLCKQINHVCEHECDYGSNLCLRWDLQGTRDIESAALQLRTREIRDATDKADWQRLKGLTSCGEIIEGICAAYEGPREKKTVVLLIDEADILIHFADSGRHEFMANLKSTFETVENLRVVIVSPPRILRLSEYPDIPQILENFQTYYLREFDTQEGRDLIRLTRRPDRPSLEFTENGSQIIDDILEVSNRVPFYIQRICGEIFDELPRRSPHQVMETLIEQQRFSPFFTSDFSELHSIQKIMLLKLVNSSEGFQGEDLVRVAKDVSREIKGKIPTLKYVDELVSLGILKKYKQNLYHFSNRLFDRWILRDYDNLWNQIMKDTKLNVAQTSRVLHSKSLKAQGLAETEATLKAAFDALRILDRDHDDGDVDDEHYFKRRKAMFRDQYLQLGKLKDHLSAQRAGPLAAALDSIDQKPGIIDEKLKEAVQAGEASNWGPVANQTLEESTRTGADRALEVACKVAKLVLEPGYNR